MSNVGVEPFRRVVRTNFDFGNIAGMANGKDVFKMDPGRINVNRSAETVICIQEVVIESIIVPCEKI